MKEHRDRFYAQIELAELAALASAVIAVLPVGFLCRRLFSGTVGATPLLRHAVISPARQENKDAVLPRSNAPLCSFILYCCF
jgi:hypothetical protein